jgi:hypothetical protein
MITPHSFGINALEGVAARLTCSAMIRKLPLKDLPAMHKERLLYFNWRKSALNLGEVLVRPVGRGIVIYDRSCKTFAHSRFNHAAGEGLFWGLQRPKEES